MASAYVIAAICGCWVRESGINPGIFESLRVVPWDAVWGEYGANTGGYGLGQWTNTGGDHHGRLWQLHTWVTGAGYQDGDGVGQLAFLIHENVWYNSSQQRGSYRTLTEFLESDSTNLEDLVWDFLASWEGVPGDAYAERVENAKKCLAHIQAHKDDKPTDYQWISNNTYLSWTDSLNNLMCVYFGLNGYVPPGPTPEKKKKMKLYFMLKKGRCRR